MKKTASIFFIITIFFWILPLGAFIKPADQKIACDGQRPFHMCCIEGSQVLQESDIPAKISFSSASSSEKNPKVSGGSGNDFMIVRSETAILDKNTLNEDTLFNRPRNLTFSPPDPVPKF